MLGVMFELAGLDPDEGSVYRALLRLDTTAPGEIATQLGIDVDEVTSRLHTMERKDLVTRVPSARGRFRAAPPELAFAPELADRRERLEEVQNLIGLFVEEYRSESARHGADELIEVVYGRQAVARRFAQLQLAAEREVLGLLREPMHAVPPSETAASQAALDAGVEYRTVYDLALLEMPGIPTRSARACGGARTPTRPSTCR